MTDPETKPKMPGGVTVDLDYPVHHDGRDYPSLSFRRMKAKDALVSEDEKNEARAGYLLFARLADVPVEVIEELDLTDLEKVGVAVAPLMGKHAAEALKEHLAKAPT